MATYHCPPSMSREIAPEAKYKCTSHAADEPEAWDVLKAQWDADTEKIEVECEGADEKAAATGMWCLNEQVPKLPGGSEEATWSHGEKGDIDDPLGYMATVQTKAEDAPDAIVHLWDEKANEVSRRLPYPNKPYDFYLGTYNYIDGTVQCEILIEVPMYEYFSYASGLCYTPYLDAPLTLEAVKVMFGPTQVYCAISVGPEQIFRFQLETNSEIVPSACSFKIYPNKKVIKMTLTKAEASLWSSPGYSTAPPKRKWYPDGPIITNCVENSPYLEGVPVQPSPDDAERRYHPMRPETLVGEHIYSNQKPTEVQPKAMETPEGEAME